MTPNFLRPFGKKNPAVLIPNSCEPQASNAMCTQIRICYKMAFIIIKPVIREHVISFMNSRTYEGWNFNSDNYLFTTDTK